VPEVTRGFADCLRSLRMAAGMSQYALAKRSGLSKQALSNLELGAREPTWATVQRLAAALGVTCQQFEDPALSVPMEETPARGRGRPRKEPFGKSGEQKTSAKKRSDQARKGK
jgi:transcriptional regulator with XRE-family HTH domain